MLKNTPFAIADFSLAIRLNGNDYRAYYNRGCASGRQGSYTAAMRDFTQALQLNPNNPEAYLNRGMAHYNLGYHQKALIDLEQAAKYFLNQGKTLAYQQTVDLIGQIQEQTAVFA